MSFDRFLTTPVTVVTPGTTTNAYGDTIDNWSSTSARSTFGWFVQRRTEEVVDGRDTVIVEDVLFLAGDDPITARDRCVIATKTYKVDGLPLRAPTPEGVHHVEVTLRRTEG